MKYVEPYINNLPDAPQQSGYLTIAYNACVDFQGKIRRSGIKSFSVWDYLEKCFKENWKSKYRKPPRANTILHWFEDDPITGMKMGAEDLAQICLFINDYTPLIAYHEEMLSRFDNIKSENKIDSKEKLQIKDSALTLAESVGDLCGEIKNALEDGKLSAHEKQSIKKLSKMLEDANKKIIEIIKCSG